MISLLSGCGKAWMSISERNASSSAPASGGNVVLSDSISAPIPAGIYSGVAVCSVSSPTLIASNIKDGVTILGILGAYTGGAGGGSGISLASMISRDDGATQISLTQEAVTDAGTAYNYTGHRVVPEITKDEDGYPINATRDGIDPVKLAARTVDRSTWGASTCGDLPADDTIAKKIAHCNSVFGTNATWDGSTKGISGEGTWVLVSRIGDKVGELGREVWRDERTKLLWSSLVSSAGLNWCMASGNRQADDPSNFCNDVTYQAQLPDDAISACAEGAGLTNIHAQIDNSAKAGLSLTSTPSVAWRLPTANDYKLADLNGIRFVLPDTGVYDVLANQLAVKNFDWVATGLSYSNANYAYRYSTSMGWTDMNTRTALQSVRCVGR